MKNISRRLLGKVVKGLAFLGLTAGLLITAGVAMAGQANDNATTTVDRKLAELMTIYGNSTIFPTEEQWRNLLLYPNDQPIVTTSFMQMPTGEVYDEKLGFRGSVAEALEKYIEATTPLIQRLGVKPIYVASVQLTIIGDDSNQWDTVVVTEYPSAEAFIELHLDPEYVENSLPYRRLTTKRAIMLLSLTVPPPG